ncbi:two-component system sensor histidine kinase NtrB [Hyphomonas sp. NPDC076900]|uniref:two-component system sensor histidine kinase NtrB n=1 Tax=unclassified Hyphomonas TaxID=2630699 RepID=UPI003D0584F2
MAQQQNSRRGPFLGLDSRATILFGLVVALFGSIVGYVLTAWLGTAGKLESAFIAGCAVAVVVFILMLVKPSPVPAKKVSRYATVFFSLYLLAVGLAAIWGGSDFYSLLPYLFWYYPLLAYSKLNNVGKRAALLDRVMVGGPIILLLVYASAHPEVLEPDLLGILWAAGVSHAACVILLGRLAGYREALADARARAEEIRRSADTLKQNESRFLQVMHEAGLGLGMIDPHGRVAWANETATGWTGRGSIISLPYAELVPDRERQSWQTQVRLLQAGDIPRIRFEYIVETQSGPRVIESNFFLAPPASTLPAGIIFVCRDITDLHELDAQLRQSQKMEALGRLTGGIAHDFNNLLTVMLGSAEALKFRFGPGTEEHELAEIIEEAGDRGAGLVRHLLAFSQNQMLRPQSMSASGLVRASILLLKPGLPESIELHTDLEDGNWQILVDPGQFEAALLNLTVNARDAMPSGGRISIKVSLLDAGTGDTGGVSGDRVVVSVSDTGEGIPPQQLARVFEPFFTTKPADKGTGLGLSIVYGFVRQSGGDVQIRSRVGRGTEVMMIFPRHSGNACAA